jgi:glycosyltransferase involved in cell wall biosynthesis
MQTIDTLSIVVPCYNAGETIVETVRSALDQRGVSVEVIVVDDGSTDGPEHVLAQARLLEQIQFVWQPNTGVSTARNRGLELAKGRYVCFLDSDDFLEPGFGVQMVDLLRSRRGRFGYCAYRHFADAPGRPKLNIRYPTPEGFVPGLILNENFIPTPGAVLLERSVLGELRFDPRRQGTEDWWLWMQLCMREPVHFNPACLLNIRVRNDSLGRRKAEMVLDTAGLFEEAEKLVASADVGLTRTDRARFHYRVASAMLDAGRSREAGARWAKATMLGLGAANHGKLLGKVALRALGAHRPVERALWRRRTGR